MFYCQMVSVAFRLQVVASSSLGLLLKCMHLFLSQCHPFEVSKKSYKNMAQEMDNEETF